MSVCTYIICMWLSLKPNQFCRYIIGVMELLKAIRLKNIRTAFELRGFENSLLLVNKFH